MGKICYFIVPLLVGSIFLLGLNKYLDASVSEMLKEKELTCILNDSLSNIKDKGVIANNSFLENESIFMLGSSELGHATKQHPTYYFNTNRSKNEIVTIGRAYNQSMQDATILGSMDPDINNKKIVILVSMQWFMDKEGVTYRHFQNRFSPVQFYSFLENPKISKANKIKFAKRVSKLLCKSDEYKSEWVYAKLYKSDSIISNIEKLALTPYFNFRKYTVELKDKGTLYSKLATLPNKSAKRKKGTIDWNKEKQIAILDAKKSVGNNDLFIDKEYYRKNFGESVGQFSGRYNNIKLLESKEFDDYEFDLDICNDLGIRPVIVMIPAMDKYYNITGISRTERDKYYNKIKNMAQKYDFDVIDLRDKETEKYYLRDVMHLGTKGWVDVCERLYKRFDQ